MRGQWERVFRLNCVFLDIGKDLLDVYSAYEAHDVRLDLGPLKGTYPFLCVVRVQDEQCT
jgi:hypothetical protein